MYTDRLRLIVYTHQPQVSMAHAGDRLELERAFSGATVHDCFNMLLVGGLEHEHDFYFSNFFHILHPN